MNSYSGYPATYREVERLLKLERWLRTDSESSSMRKDTL